MKLKIIIASLITLALVACTISFSKGDEKEVIQADDGGTYEIHWLAEEQRTGDHSRYIGKLIVDDCIYIVIRGYHEMTLTHAGNCSNPIHTCK